MIYICLQRDCRGRKGKSVNRNTNAYHGKLDYVGERFIAGLKVLVYEYRSYYGRLYRACIAAADEYNLNRVRNAGFKIVGHGHAIRSDGYYRERGRDKDYLAWHLEVEWERTASKPRRRPLGNILYAYWRGLRFGWWTRIEGKGE